MPPSPHRRRPRLGIWPPPSPGSGSCPAGGQLVVFPGHTLVALYGTPGSKALGVLGEQDLPSPIRGRTPTAAPYRSLSARTVVPAFEIIATIASGVAGPDGDYSARAPGELRPWIEARGRGGPTSCWICSPVAPTSSPRPSGTDLLDAAVRGPRARPRVAPGPGPGHLGRSAPSASTRSTPSSRGWRTSRQRALPQKMLVLHQFRVEMIADRDRLDTSRDELRVGHPRRRAGLPARQGRHLERPAHRTRRPCTGGGRTSTTRTTHAGPDADLPGPAGAGPDHLPVSGCARPATWRPPPSGAMTCSWDRVPLRQRLGTPVTGCARPTTAAPTGSDRVRYPAGELSPPVAAVRPSGRTTHNVRRRPAGHETTTASDVVEFLLNQHQQIHGTARRRRVDQRRGERKLLLRRRAGDARPPRDGRGDDRPAADPQGARRGRRRRRAGWTRRTRPRRCSPALEKLDVDSPEFTSAVHRVPAVGPGRTPRPRRPRSSRCCGRTPTLRPSSQARDRVKKCRGDGVRPTPTLTAKTTDRPTNVDGTLRRDARPGPGRLLLHR